MGSPSTRVGTPIVLARSGRNGSLGDTSARSPRQANDGSDSEEYPHPRPRHASPRSGTVRGAFTPVKIAIVLSTDPSASVDGIRDYSERLAAELGRRGHRVRVLALGSGLVPSLGAIRRSCRRGRGLDWTMLQYSHLAWSRRGFPLGALAIAATVRLGGTKLAVTIHDPLPFAGNRTRDRLRTSTQLLVMRLIVLLAHRTFVTVDPSVISWADGRTRAALSFVPVGSNVGVTTRAHAQREEPTVVVFGVTENNVAEATRIARVVRTARRSLPDLTLRVMGRGAQQSMPVLQRELDRSDVRLSVHGIIAAREVALHIADADVLLFLRGGASSRRGTIAAAIACGTPIVAERGSETTTPIIEAGLELVPLGDDAAAAAAIVRIVEDQTWSAKLSSRNREAYDRWFSWESIGTRINEWLE
jgi:glycosyltransferase involved in cell wall biosynthesis